MCWKILYKTELMTQKKVLSRLVEGNERFVADMRDGKLSDANRRKVLTKGQNPWAIVLSCADSRVVPEMAFDTGLGELFTVRVAGNVANASSVASIEYAVAHCGSKVIVVMGHQSCGAVTAAMAGGDNGYNINHLLAHIAPAIGASRAKATVNSVVKKNAMMVAEELINRSTIIREAVMKSKVLIVPAYYNLDSGKVDFL
jgi:carbonic anhydrase